MCLESIILEHRVVITGIQIGSDQRKIERNVEGEKNIQKVGAGTR